ncbi:MAG: 23S rRNA (adenine(2503)-C(2))-methyltransferase RlmN [Spirochaetales bacterium]|nr:23S rRNA (adenine(2503)-C(2))-methyltransferase RlmN [Spirochaetales bacterium]
MKQALSGLTPEQINKQCLLDKKFIGKQIFSWIQKPVLDFDKMTNISSVLREKLEKKHKILSSRILGHQEDEYGTQKILIELEDKHRIETVLLNDGKDRQTICLSTQAGCAMKCRFCRTGEMGFKRNLTHYEIIEQYLLMAEKFGNISNVVFMGMGEPLLNLPEVRKAVKILHHLDGQNISLRKMTLSTCGIVKGIKEMTQEGPHIRLALSLFSVDQAVRKQFMPCTKKNPLEDLKEALVEYQAVMKREVTLEITMIKSINDSAQAARAILSWIKPLRVNINLIPLNPGPDSELKAPSPESVNSFKSILQGAGFSVSQRFQKGDSISAACGQLASFT